jgi:hypothetical protein
MTLLDMSRRRPFRPFTISLEVIRPTVVPSLDEVKALASRDKGASQGY